MPLKTKIFHFFNMEIKPIFLITGVALLLYLATKKSKPVEVEM